MDEDRNIKRKTYPKYLLVSNWNCFDTNKNISFLLFLSMLLLMNEDTQKNVKIFIFLFCGVCLEIMSSHRIIAESFLRI